MNPAPDNPFPRRMRGERQRANPKLALDPLSVHVSASHSAELRAFLQCNGIRLQSITEEPFGHIITLQEDEDPTRVQALIEGWLEGVDRLPPADE